MVKEGVLVQEATSAMLKAARMNSALGEKTVLLLDWDDLRPCPLAFGLRKEIDRGLKSV